MNTVLSIVMSCVLCALPIGTGQASGSMVHLVTHPGLSEHRDDDHSGQTQIKLHRGQVMKIDGTKWVIRDTSGEQVRFTVDRKTELRGRPPKVGQIVEAAVSPAGHADVLTNISDTPGETAAP